jgi:antitoxin HigA-1
LKHSWSHHRIIWKLFAGPETANTAYASTNSGEFVSHGKAVTPTTSKSSTTIEEIPMSKRDFPPIHPGEILLAEFLEPLAISQYRLAKDIGVTPRRINEIVHGRRAITADTALRLGRYFNMEAQFWLNLQSHYDMEVALESLGDRLEKEVTPLTRAA